MCGCLFTCRVFVVFSDFQDYPNLDPLAPAQSKHVFAFWDSRPTNHEKVTLWGAFWSPFGSIFHVFGGVFQGSIFNEKWGDRQGAGGSEREPLAPLKRTLSWLSFA